MRILIHNVYRFITAYDSRLTAPPVRVSKQRAATKPNELEPAELDNIWNRKLNLSPEEIFLKQKRSL